MDRKDFLASIRPASQAANKYVRSLDAEAKLAYKTEVKKRRAEQARERYHTNREACIARRKELREQRLIVLDSE